MNMAPGLNCLNTTTKHDENVKFIYFYLASSTKKIVFS